MQSDNPTSLSLAKYIWVERATRPSNSGHSQALNPNIYGSGELPDPIISGSATFGIYQVLSQNIYMFDELPDPAS
jgi:hypothetical protein